MAKYTVYLKEDGFLTEIDQIEAEAGYSAEQYVKDCEENADPEWIEMLHEAEEISVEETAPVTMAWKVWGADGHRQRISFEDSVRYDWSDETETRIVEIEAADKTGSHDFVIIRITRDTAIECIDEFNGQLTDGIFENARYGKIEELQ